MYALHIDEYYVRVSLHMVPVKSEKSSVKSEILVENS